MTLLIIFKHLRCYSLPPLKESRPEIQISKLSAEKGVYLQLNLEDQGNFDLD